MNSVVAAEVSKGTPGLYQVRNALTGHHYVGASLDLRRRLRSHQSLLKRGAHHNVHLQRAWDRDGEAVFSFNVVAVLEQGDVYQTEQKWLDAVVGTPLCYNINPLADAPIHGRKASAETRARMSAAAKGKKKAPRTAEHRAALSAARKGKAMGRVLSPEHKAAMQEGARRVGKSEAQLEHISQLNVGKKFAWLVERNRSAMTPEVRAKISASKRGKSLSTSVRAKISASMLETKNRARVSAQQSLISYNVEG